MRPPTRWRAWFACHALRVVLLGLLASCRSTEPHLRVDVRLPAGVSVEVAQIALAPAGHVSQLRLETGGTLRMETDGRALEVRVPGLCPIQVPAAAGDQERQVSLHARPLLAAPTTLSQVGFDASFSISVTPGCDEAARATLRWRQLEGAALPALTASADGLHLSGRTLPLSSYFPQGLPHGIAPVSPRTQGRYVLEAEVAGLARALPPLRVTITSISRATGLPSLAVSQRVLLGGEGWRVARRPPGSRAEVEHATDASSFQPDVAGRFDLIDATGRKLELSALRHDLTPLDCGRAECHAALSRAALDSPMSRAFQRPFERGAARLDQQGCMLDCHVVGEAGLHDGGFRDGAHALGFQPAAPMRVAELPHALQRLAGVRCTSCHGPGAVPPHEGRSRILRADVCATCHDAPPAYNHVAQWRASRMAQADVAPDTRTRAECAQCHTTGGFLHRVGVRPRADLSRDDAPVGISCAACHAPHAPHLERALVRELEPSTSGEVSAVCIPCHSPVPDSGSPSASAATLARAAVELPAELGGGTLSAGAPHGELRAGCMGCHGKRDAQPAKTDHSFKVDPTLCASCHAQETRARWSTDKRALRARAETLWSDLMEACGGPTTLAAGTPPHAVTAQLRCRSLPLTRARYLLALVIEDGAAFEHNAPLTRELLDQVAAALSRP